MNGIETIPQFIARFKAENFLWNSRGFLDDSLLYLYIVEDIRSLGQLPFVEQETMITITDHKGTLPADYYCLRLLMLCKGHGYEEHIQEPPIAIPTGTVREEIHRNIAWRPIDPIPTPIRTSYVTEVVTTPRGKKLYHYSHPEMVAIKNIQEVRHQSLLINRLYPRSKIGVIIKGEHIDCDAEYGFMFVKYRGLLTDEHGVPYIPDFGNGDIRTYLDATIKRRIYEQLLGNQDATGNEANSTQMWDNRVREYRKKANNELLNSVSRNRMYEEYTRETFLYPDKIQSFFKVPNRY